VRLHPLSLAFAAALGSLCCGTSPLADWPQWGQNGQHTGAAASSGQALAAIHAQLVNDPFTAQEKAENGGVLLSHYAVPLLEGGDAYVVVKSGRYTSCVPPGSGRPFPCGSDAWALQTWSVTKQTSRGDSLVAAWSAPSDWKPAPDAGALGGWEPVFQPVLTREFLWMPGAGGSVLRVSKDSGEVLARVNPFGDDADRYVVSGLAADEAGSVFYAVVAFAGADPWGKDVREAWLVKVAASGAIRAVAFSQLTPQAPPAAGLCQGSFVPSQLPWPPAPEAVAPARPCGSQRPALNAVPAIAPDGTVYVVSRAHLNDRYGYLVAVGSDLSPRWAASLRGLLDDGCDVSLPPSGSPGGCRAGAVRGVDPATNDRPAARVLDLSTSSPVVLPDGSIVYGAYSRYNDDRGHLLQFSAAGAFLASYDFGWDITPAVYAHDGRYSIIMKDNHYEAGSYCDDARFCPVERPRYEITQLDARLRPEWRFANTQTESCERRADGALACAADHPDGFEWCVNQPAVDARGVVYANAEDGFVYAIAQGGALRDRLFLSSALGAAYTPVSLSGDGFVFTQNNGVVYRVGR